MCSFLSDYPHRLSYGDHTIRSILLDQSICFHRDSAVMFMVHNGLSIENNCNIHLTSGKELINFQGYRLVRISLS